MPLDQLLQLEAEPVSSTTAALLQVHTKQLAPAQCPALPGIVHRGAESHGEGVWRAPEGREEQLLGHAPSPMQHRLIWLGALCSVCLTDLS